MHKALLCLATSTALTATAVAPTQARADASLYGSIRVVAIATSHDDPALEREVSIDSAASRFGLRGSEEIGNGLKLGARYEFAVSADKATIDDDNRLSYVSLEGRFGEIQAGQVWSTYWNILGNGWPAINVSGDGLKDVTTFRLPDSVKWTKSVGATTVSLLAQLDDGVQRTQGSLEYKVAGLSLGLGFDQELDESSAVTAADPDGNAENDTSVALLLGYTLDNGLGATAIVTSDDNGVDDATTGYNLIGLYSANDNTFILSYGDNNTDADDDETVSFELARAIGERSTAWIGYESSEPSQSFQIGLRHNW